MVSFKESYLLPPSLMLWMICRRLIDTENICLPACSTSWYFFTCALFSFYNCCSFLVLLLGQRKTDYNLVSPTRDDFFNGNAPCLK